MAAKRGSVVAVMAQFALAYMVTSAALSQACASQLENQVRRILVSIDADISDEAGVLKTRLHCKVESFGEQFCIQSSILAYSVVMQAIRDQTIDVSGRTLEFATLMPPRPRKGESTDFVVLAASWDGSELMRISRDGLSPYAAVDLVQSVEADRDWRVQFALAEQCTSLYGHPPRFCAMAKRSARR